MNTMKVQIEDIAEYLQNSYFYDEAGELKRRNSDVSEWVLVVDATGAFRYTSSNLAEALRSNDRKAEDLGLLNIADLFATEPEMGRMVLAAIADDCCIETDLEVGRKTLLMRVFPFTEGGLVLLRDVTEIRSTQYRVKELASEVRMLTEKLELRKRADRAKSILMSHGMDEPEAHRRMRKAAMDSGKTLREVAESIILAESIRETSQS